MNAGAKLAVYGLVLALVLAAGAAVGAAAGPIYVSSGGSHTPAPAPARDLPAGGLLVAQDGYRLVALARTLDGDTFEFTITGPNGQPVEDYELLHERRLHLIVASRDLRSYVHLHPQRADDGTWSVEVPDLPPGAYRAFADFQPADDEQLTLGVDVWVPGPAAHHEPLEPVASATVDDFQVTMVLDDGIVTVTVYRNGEVVDTEPYLGAAGHLVALRDGDLAYLHVHPLDDGRGAVRFAVEVPSAGTYALFFDFQVDGVLRTAPLVLTTDSQALDQPNRDDGGGDHGEGGHG